MGMNLQTTAAFLTVGGFWIDKREASEVKEKVEEALKEIGNVLRIDGGDIELVDVVDNVVKVKLKGACAGCPFSQMTIKNFVERELKKSIPEVEKVEALPLQSSPA